MEYSLFSKEKVNRCKKKVIPWHVQKRYMESLSQLSFNQTIATAFYKKEIKSLKRNNKHLALALQQSRYLATEKENLMLDNGKILDIVNFSRLKLMDMATNMKQATACLDETLLLLNSAIKDSLSKCSPKNRYRNEFKCKLQELKIESIKEVIESTSKNLNSPNKNDPSCVQKGKISRVDDCISPPNKKCKLGKKAEKIKRNTQDVPKREKSSTALPNAASKNTSVKDSKKCGSTINIKSQRKKSLPKSSNTESPLSVKIPTSSSDRTLQSKNKQKYQDKNCKAVKVMLTDIAEAFVKIDSENSNSPETNGPISSMSSTNFKCLTQNSDEDNMLIKKFISSEITSKQKSSSPNSFIPPFASTINDAEIPPVVSIIKEVLPFSSTISNAEVPPIVSTINNIEVSNFSQNTSNSSSFSIKKLSSANDPIVKKELSALSSKENEDFVYDQASTVGKMHQIEKGENNSKHNNRRYIKNTDLEKDKRSNKSCNTTVSRKVQFYFDEDSIESADGETTASKNRIRKSINKCKARKTVSNVKRNISSKSTALKSNCILPDNISKLGKNSFLVTAEVHSPHNGAYYVQEMKNKMCVNKKREPCVVLTDIFKSNQGLLSEMVGNGLYENECLQKTYKNSAEASLAAFPVNALDANYMDFENNAVDDHLLEDRSVIKKVFCQERSEENKNICKNQPTVLKNIVNYKKAFKKCHKAYSNEKNRINSAWYLSHDKENRCLSPADRKIIEEREKRRRSKIVSYKEPSLNVKMRRLI